jgi:hypothetical protein
MGLISRTIFSMFDYKVGSKIYPKLKEVDDVLGGKAAWENVDSTQGGNYQGSRFTLPLFCI